MTHPTDALRLVPILKSWCEGGLLQSYEQVAERLFSELAAAPASPLPEGGGQCSGITGELSGWQDISTAPKDGTPLLAGSIHHSDREVVCWQDGLPSGSMDTDAAWEGWVNDGPQKDRFYVNPRYFTHFMPLPAAPTGAK